MVLRDLTFNSFGDSTPDFEGGSRDVPLDFQFLRGFYIRTYHYPTNPVRRSFNSFGDSTPRITEYVYDVPLYFQFLRGFY